MKKSYIHPASEALNFGVESMISVSATGTNVPGLGVDNDNPTEDEGRAKTTTVDWQKWD